MVLPPDPHFFDLDYDTIGCEADELAGPGEGYPYPGAFTQPPPPTQAPAEGNPYPGPGFPTPSATRLSGAAPFTPTGTLRSPWSPTPPPPAFIPTQPAPIMTEAIPQPSFPTATRVPFLSPTPTLTQTPTVTPTRRPPSPWVSSRLRATDPRTVKLASGKPQLVEFFAFWSGPSQAMAPIVHSLEQSYADQVNFTYLDIDDPANKAFKTKLGFRFEPHFFLLDAQGNILDQWVGYVQTQEFIDAFDAALRK